MNAKGALSSANQTWIVADIGGTNMRFATVDPDSPRCIQSIKKYPCADHDSIYSGLSRYLEDIQQEDKSLGLSFAVAGPLQRDPDLGQRIDMINLPWSIDEASLRKEFNATTIILANDFTAVAHSLPWLNETDTEVVANAKKNSDKGASQYLVVGPGSGLGVASLITTNDQRVVLSTEGGHVGFAPTTVLQHEVNKVLGALVPRVVNEHIVSGPGIVNVYQALGVVGHIPVDDRIQASTIFELATKGDPLAASTVDFFFEALGQICGDFVLGHGSYDGVYIAGGICQRYPDLLRKSKFIKHYIDKGPYQPILERMSINLIMHEDPGMLGAAAMISA